MIFMKDADIAKQYGITQSRLNAILNENKPIEKYKMDQALELMEEENEEIAKEEDPMLQFKYDLSKLSQFNKQE
jgi:phage antirepressor YoqD-like protein